MNFLEKVLPRMFLGDEAGSTIRGAFVRDYAGVKERAQFEQVSAVLAESAVGNDFDKVILLYTKGVSCVAQAQQEHHEAMQKVAEQCPAAHEARREKESLTRNIWVNSVKLDINTYLTQVEQEKETASLREKAFNRKMEAHISQVKDVQDEFLRSVLDIKRVDKVRGRHGLRQALRHSSGGLMHIGHQV